MRQQWLRALIGLLCLAVLGLHVFRGRAGDGDVVSRLDWLAYDLRVRLTMPATTDERIVIIDVDEKSLAEQGRWPWGRDKLALLVTQLFDKYQINTLGFDFVFAEPDISSGIKTLERLAQSELKDNGAYLSALNRLRPSLDNDARFAAAIKGRRVVLGFPFSGGENSGVLPAPVLSAKDFLIQPWLPFTNYSAYNGNLDILQSAAVGAGHFVPNVDDDGVIRRVPLLFAFQNNYYEALSLAVLRTYLGLPEIAPYYPAEPAVVKRDLIPAEGITLKSPRSNMVVPVDPSLSAFVPYRGSQGSFVYISATDVMQGRVARSALAGRIVLVGTTAPGLKDQRATPVLGAYPGVEIHANLISGMLDGTVKQQPSYMQAVELLLLLLVGVLMIFVLPRFSPLIAGVGSLLLLLSVLGMSMLFWRGGYIFPVAHSMILIGALFAINMSWGYFSESRSKRQFAELFGQYVPPELVDEMARNPESYSMEGRRAELSVLFSDIRGFTTISEGMEPEALASLMNEYLGAMTQVVQSHRGTLDKYIGDAIMAFWGAPVNDPQHVRNAVLTALDMQKSLSKLNEQLIAKGMPKLAIGVGVNTGTVTVGDMGSPVRKAYTVLGDAVNLASRLEGITKSYGVGIVVGAATRSFLRKEFVFRELDCVRVKGKDEPVAIYEPLGLEGEISAETLEALKLWQQVLADYRAQRWDQAELMLMNLQRMAPHYLYDLYSQRIAHYRAHPPPEDWGGVTTFETK